MGETTLIKAIADKSDWLIITIFVLWIAFKIIMFLIEKKHGTKSNSDIQKQHATVLDSINYKLKVIYAQYGAELSKEAAIFIIQNFYLNFANSVADEIYALQKKDFAHDKIISNIKNKLVILNNEKMQELGVFIYKNRIFVTHTNGMVVDPEKIINIINNYSNKNGMLREEIQNLLSIEAGIVINRL
jgi:hypothetical protein